MLMSTVVSCAKFLKPSDETARDTNKKEDTTKVPASQTTTSGTAAAPTQNKETIENSGKTRKCEFVCVRLT